MRRQMPFLTPVCAMLCMLLFSTACGDMRKSEENWNSYYYGGYQEVNGKFTYEGISDNDSAYVPPTNAVNGSATGVPSPNMLQVRPMMRSGDGR